MRIISLQIRRPMAKLEMDLSAFIRHRTGAINRSGYFDSVINSVCNKIRSEIK